MRKKIPGWLVGGIFIAFGVVICLPVFILISGSLADGLEWRPRTVGDMCLIHIYEPPRRA